MRPQLLNLLPGVVVIGLLSACASTPLVEPADEMSTAQYAIDEAQQNGAAEYAQLPLYKAQQKFDKAEALINQQEPAEGDYAKAQRLAEKAAMDAQYALAKAQAERAQAQAADVRDGMNTLKQQISQ